jgi:tetratricopeptide (TPR) repeat protein
MGPRLCYTCSVSFFKRLFSSDHRAAISAEAAGDFELAAQRYALAGQHDAAVRMHLARADRAKNRAEEINALRDALHWAKEHEGLLPQAAKALGKALIAQSQAEGVKTQRDRERVREAAELFLSARNFEHAGDAFTSVGDHEGAARAYKGGGLVAKMELALGHDQEKRDAARSERQSFADYDLHMRGGARDEALISLRHCLQSSESRSDYRRLLDELESRLITGGRVVLKMRNGKRLAFCAASEILIGRDALCDMVLRTGGVSRRHASILISASEEGTQFELGDAGSRNGTRLAGMPIDTRLPLTDSGSFQLGDDVEIHFEILQDTPVLQLEVRSGLDKGTRILATRDGVFMSLQDLGIDAKLCFREGRPTLQHPGGKVSLNGESLAHGNLQLIHGDLLTLDGIEIEVA